MINPPCAGDIISIFLAQRLGAVPSNMHIISNMMTYDDKVRYSWGEGTVDYGRSN